MCCVFVFCAVLWYNMDGVLIGVCMRVFGVGYRVSAYSDMRIGHGGRYDWDAGRSGRPDLCV